ncbi:hypothetical protein HWV07_00365 [Natronomonas salina]|uniref:hypothetical protein n=1 Tax=Natronomonas salina TaxID=1710540 RepID=UPI0015B56001|nr:hypothetical protein [Natronomonas salina]QLD87569.1 hypothetical protein HWV07_00365 [Natronomonas salina]
MDPRHRDGLLALAGLGVLLAGSLATVGAGPLLDPAAAAVGVAGAGLLEVAFLRYPGVLLAAWERRYVPLVGLLVVLGLGSLAVLFAPVLVGALAWGLVTYLALLACVLAGLGNPLSAVSRRSDGE